MKRFFLMNVLLLINAISWAYDFEFNGIYYSVISAQDLTCKVVKGENSYNFEEMVIPEEVSFSGNTLLVIAIEEASFYNANIEKLVIPPSIKTIYEGAFCNAHIDYLQIDESREELLWTNGSLTCIQNQLSDNGSLREVFIGRTINYTNPYTSSLFGNNYLETITFGSLVKKVPKLAFRGYNNNVTSVLLPNSITEIGDYAFDGCRNLKDVYWSDGLTKIGKFAFDGTNLEAVELPEGITEIGNSAFSGCKNLRTISLPESLTIISSYLFSSCENLLQVTIPQNITSIQSKAFKGCKLDEINVQATNPPIASEDSFDGITYLTASLFVPESSLSLYKSTNPWSNFISLSGDNNSSGSSNEKCAAPTIEYCDGKLHFNSSTPNASFLYSIDNHDVAYNSISSDGTATLSGIFEVSAVARAAGYLPSEKVTQTIDFKGLKEIVEIPVHDTLYVEKEVVITDTILVERTESPQQYVTIRQGENGSVSYYVEGEKYYSYKISVSENWAIHSVSYNGEDVTYMLEDNTYHAPLLNDDAEIIVAYESIIESLDIPRFSQATVTGSNKTIHINNTDAGDTILIFNADGQMIKSQQSNGERIDIETMGGQYIIKVKDLVVKISL